MMCSRVLILHEGKILAADTPENLQQLMSGKGQVIAEIAAPQDELRTCWEEMGEVEYYDLVPVADGFIRCALTPRDGIDLRPHIFALARERGWILQELTRTRHSLEDIYLRVTRRDEEEEES